MSTPWGCINVVFIVGVVYLVNGNILFVRFMGDMIFFLTSVFNKIVYWCEQIRFLVILAVSRSHFSFVGFVKGAFG